MICVIHDHGTSFKGLGQYVLHDKRADTAERVAWSHTHNLATQDPELASRIMAATAMDNQALKEAAGIPSTGRKLQKSVMHYTLSWHAEERGGLTREEMIRAAEASLASLGNDEGEKLGKNRKTGRPIIASRAQHGIEHQAVIVCHDEGEGSKPHVHIMVNRVHPEHGVVLPDNNNFEKLSDWALQYRKQQNKEHYCPERVKNAAVRAQGYRTHTKRVPRNVYEDGALHREAFKRSPKHAALLEQHRQKAALLKAKQDDLKQKQRKELRDTENQILEEEKRDRVALAEQARKARNEKRNAFRSKVEELAELQVEEKEAFKEAQATMKGRVRASLDAVMSKDWMNELRSNPLKAATQAFKMAISKDLQESQLKESQEREKRELQAELTKEQAMELKRLRDEIQIKKQERLQHFEATRNETLLKQGMDQAKMKAEWKQLQVDRAMSLALLTLPSPAREPQKPPPLKLKPAFDIAANPKPTPKREESDGRHQERPKTQEEIVAERRAAFRAKMESQRERGKDRGHDRER